MTQQADEEAATLHTTETITPTKTGNKFGPSFLNTPVYIVYCGETSGPTSKQARNKRCNNCRVYTQRFPSNLKLSGVSQNGKLCCKQLQDVTGQLVCAASSIWRKPLRKQTRTRKHVELQLAATYRLASAPGDSSPGA